MYNGIRQNSRREIVRKATDKLQIIHVFTHANEYNNQQIQR